MVLDHWTDEDHHDVQKKAKTMQHLVEVGLRMAKKMKAESPDGSLRLLSGPMTTGGFWDFDVNMHVFEQAIVVAREHGWYVYNQLPFQHGFIRLLNLGGDPTITDMSKYPQSILDDFYWPLIESGLITHVDLLPTWNTSNGSTQELNKSLEVSTILIQEFPPRWYLEVLRRSRPYIIERCMEGKFKRQGV